MDKKITISLLVFFISFLPIASGLGAADNRQVPLGDGLALSGIDGRLVSQDSNNENRNFAADIWLFEFDADVSDGKGIVHAGESLELLPSSVLGKMIADANNGSGTSYRLWGRITQYKDKNFIFPNYFLPLTGTKEPNLPILQKPSQQESRPKINEPNDILTIPKELIDKLPDKKKRIDHTTREQNIDKNGTEPGAQTKSELRDFILADRCGFIRESGQAEQNRWQHTCFVADALGRNKAKDILHLLPCQVLEQAQRTQSAAPDALRFKVAGIVTRFKGKDYLLLQRATRVYSHGNFGE
jgi:hypothetical protein